MPIIDCHVHANHYDEINKTRSFAPLEKRLKALLGSMDNNNIDYSLILSSYRVDINRPSVLQIINNIKNYDNKNRLGVVAGFTIDNHTDVDLKNYRKWLKDKIIKGIKLYCGYEHYYPSNEKYQQIYDMCTEFGSPVMIHTGNTLSNTAKIKFSHPLNIDDIAVDNPELKIVMCHVGNPWIIDCQEIMYKNKNVYADISGLIIGDFTLDTERYYATKISELLSYVGKKHRLLFGSDWPICNMDSYLRFVQKMKLDQESLDLLMFKNAKSIFGI
ncbi:MAG: amidohydrolase family protein [Thermoproteota archaeon]|nr:amidohydrolase family protein [Thermoproteota archaeon]